MAPTIFRSTDTNAPILTAAPGSAIALLDACLVGGYTGAVKASGTLTSTGTAPANNDTVTIGSVTYTFKTTLTPAANEVLIGASAAAALTNLQLAINDGGVRNTNYGTGTTQQTACQATALTATTIVITALVGGTGGNSIATTETSAQLSWGSATLTGGSGTGTGGLGWTKPYTSTNIAVFKQPAGSGFYLQVTDNATGTGLSRDALCYGFETMSAFNTGTGQFPTAAQVATIGAVLRKNGATVDATNRAWLLIGDTRSFYLFVLTGDSASVYMGFGFGDFYSYIAADPYKCMIRGQSASQTTAFTSATFGALTYGVATAQSDANTYVPRNYSGVGASTAAVLIGDGAMIPTSATTDRDMVGSLYFPNPSDGGLYLCVLRIMDGGTPGTTVAGSLNLRGKMRGLYQICHATANFADGDTVNGTGAYAGRSFLILKPLMGNSTAGVIVLETTDWDTSA